VDDIDYEALATIIRGARSPFVPHIDAARAVVAAYQEQQRARGVVVVRADDLNELMGINPIGDGAARRMREALDG
jgi:hypothetical protein